ADVGADDEVAVGRDEGEHRLVAGEVGGRVAHVDGHRRGLAFDGGGEGRGAGGHRGRRARGAGGADGQDGGVARAPRDGAVGQRRAVGALDERGDRLRGADDGDAVVGGQRDRGHGHRRRGRGRRSAATGPATTAAAGQDD